MLVGNKSDLHSDRSVSVEDGKGLAREMKAIFLETSAKENQVNIIYINIADLFMILLKKFSNWNCNKCSTILQGVTDIFTRVVTEMEKDSVDQPNKDKDKCSIS